ncbi:MAG: TaqI-like C-terminal specificity domain-containing protein, partial [Candidatus Aminicenantales bacterium]
IVHFGDQQIFSGATTYTCLLFLNKTNSETCNFTKVDDLSAWRSKGEAISGVVQANCTTSSEWNFIVGRGAALFERLSNIPIKLKDVTKSMFVGQQTSADTVYLFKKYRIGKKKNILEIFSKELDEWVPLESHLLKKVVRSGDINRYHARATAVVLFPYEVREQTARLFTRSELQTDYPLVWAYLNRNKAILENREGGKFRDDQWYRFGRSQNLGLWEQPKLMIPYMVEAMSAYLDQTDNYYFINVTTGGYGITVDESSCNIFYLCGLLNSRVLNYYLKRVSTTFRGGYFAANKQYLDQLPIYKINYANLEEVDLHNQVVNLVKKLLVLYKNMTKLGTPHEIETTKRRIIVADIEIDEIICKLYGLTPEDIKMLKN